MDHVGVLIADFLIRGIQNILYGYIHNNEADDIIHGHVEGRHEAILKVSRWRINMDAVWDDGNGFLYFIVGNCFVFKDMDILSKKVSTLQGISDY